MPRALLALVLALCTLTLAACGSSPAVLEAGSPPECPAAPPTDTVCMPVGLRCVYVQSGAACPTRPYTCEGGDGGTTGTWQVALCD